VPEQGRVVEPKLADAPAVHFVPDALGHTTSVSPAMAWLGPERRVVPDRVWTVGSAKPPRPL
jgi:hypothetical protein